MVDWFASDCLFGVLNNSSIAVSQGLSFAAPHPWMRLLRMTVVTHKHSPSKLAQTSFRVLINTSRDIELIYVLLQTVQTFFLIFFMLF